MDKFWKMTLGLETAEDLNKVIEAGELNDIFAVCEAMQDRKIVEIAAKIINSRKHLILVAGPSSSGKTSFAKRLKIQLWAGAHKPLYLCTDDYFIDRDLIPFGPDGKQDFESLSAIDIELFEKQLQALLNGETVDTPVYDFKQGIKVFGTRPLKLEPDQTIIIEGIHALNDALTPHLPAEEKFKIFIKPMTQLDGPEGIIIDPDDARKIRRMVRDSEKRGWTVCQTMDMWPGIMEGERDFITPFRDDASVEFNSSQPYELSVLKKYAYPKLSAVDPEDSHYPEARRLLGILDLFIEAPDDSHIEQDSIIREFIGGSVLVE